MNEIIHFFQTATAEEFVLGLIVAAFVIRWIWDILTEKEL